MIRAIVLSAVSFGGLVLFVFFTCRLIWDMNAGKPLDRYAVKIGVPAAAVLLSLLFQRLALLAAGFLLLALLAGAVLYAAVRLGKKRERKHAGPEVTFRLIDLGKYARHISERAIVRRILKLQSLVGSIRSVVGYDKKTLIDQNADILRMENIYLPRIESLINQYIKISSHDPEYDSRHLMEQLDTLSHGIQRIQASCLSRDKMNIDAEANALISAMEMDGYGDEKDLRSEHGRDES